MGFEPFRPDARKRDIGDMTRHNSGAFTAMPILAKHPLFWIALFAFGMIASAASAQSEEVCDPLGHGLEFCRSNTSFEPLEGNPNTYVSYAPGVEEGLTLIFAVQDKPDRALTNDLLFKFAREMWARSAGVAPDALTELTRIPVTVAGHDGEQVYYFQPSGTVPGMDLDIIQSHTVAYTDEAVLIVYSFEYGTTPNLDHGLNVITALKFVRETSEAGADSAQSGEASSTCYDIGEGVSLCDLDGLGWDVIKPAEDGPGLWLDIGDTAADVYAYAVNGFTPPISEDKRLDLQGAYMADAIIVVLEVLGLDPSTVEVDSLLGVPTGADGELGLAQMESMFTKENGAVYSRAVTAYVGPDYVVVITSGNPGRGVSEDHYFLVEEIMRSVTTSEH